MIENKDNSKGRIEVICGSMFSGKTEELIKRIKKIEFSKQKFIVFKPKVDSRNPKEKIISHAKNEISSKIAEKISSDLDRKNASYLEPYDEDILFLTDRHRSMVNDVISCLKSNSPFCFLIKARFKLHELAKSAKFLVGTIPNGPLIKQA